MSELQLRIYQAGDRASWDEMVAKDSKNGTFLHSRAFFSHDPRNEGDDHSLIFHEGSRISAVLPAGLVARDGHHVLVSHPRSTYGGLVVSPRTGVEDTLRMVDLLIEHARGLGAREIVVRNPFRIFHRQPCDEIDYALWRRGFTVRAREVEVAVPVHRFAGAEELLGQMDAKTRNQVRKAQKSGITVRQSADYAGFWPLLERNLSSKGRPAPTHDLPKFQALLKAVGPEAIRFFGAYLEDRLIAGCVLFVPNELATHAQYIASEAEFSALCPVNLLVYELMVWSHAHGYRHLNLGTANEDAGKTANFGLFAFKEGFGGGGILRETMVLGL